MSEDLTSLVIVGRDVSLWLAALTLQRALHGSGARVTAIELPSRLCPGAVVGSLPALEALHRRIGVDEAELLTVTGGSMTLGWNLVVPGLRPSFLAHGSYGTSIGGGLFLPHWTRARAHGLDVPFDEFSPTAMAARFGRILLPDDETDIFGRADYAYHLPAIAYAGLLKSLATRGGVTTILADKIGTERRSDQSIAAIVADGLRVDGQLFLDASGNGALSENAAAATQAVFDRAVRATAPPFSSTPPFAEIRVDSAGTLTLQSCRAGTDVRFSYRSADLDDDAAIRLSAAIAGTALTGATIEQVVPISAEAPWIGDCVSLCPEAWCGPFDLSMHAVHLALVHLLSVFPATCDFASERNEFNRVMQSSLARLRDVGMLFDGLVPLDTAAWQEARGQAINDPNVAHRIAAFHARGEIPPLEDESLPLDFFQALCIGLGLIPQSWTPAVDRLPLHQLREEFRRMLSFIRSKVEQQPAHDAFLDSLSGAAAA